MQAAGGIRDFCLSRGLGYVYKRQVNYDLMDYIKGAASGGICCSITHGALTPVDVVTTRVQLDSAKVRLAML